MVFDGWRKLGSLSFGVVGFVLLCAIPAEVFAEYEVRLGVVDGDGDPVDGAEVTILEIDEEAVTGDDGGLLIEVPLQGGYTVLVEAEGHGPEWSEFVVDDQFSGEHLVVLTRSSDNRDHVDMAADLRTTTASPLRNPVAYQPLESLDKEQLQRRSANSYGQMLDGSPGVTARSFGPAPSRPVIRGLGGERVLVLQNGERTGDVSSTAHDHHISIDPLEAERVEIVRGPASLLYGSSALGGVVNIMDERIPRQWDDGVFSDVALYGEVGQPTGAGAASVGYGAGDHALRGRFSHRQAGDMRTPDGVMPDTGIRGTTADIGGSRQMERGLGGMSVGFQDLVFGLPEELEDHDESVELRSRRVFAQSHFDRELDGFFDNLEWRLLANYYTHDEVEIDRSGPEGALQEDLELAYDVISVSTSLTVPHGTLGFIDRGALGMQLRFRDLALSGDEVLSPDSREFSTALYIFEEVPLSQSLRLQFGIRPELHAMEPRANNRFDSPRTTRLSPTVSGSLGVHAELTDGLEMGSQIARAHRVPIVEELFSDAAHLGTGQYEIGDPDLNNEVGYGADLFLRWSTEIIATEVSAFVNHINDFIFLEPTGDVDGDSGYPVYEYQGADARLWGGEWSVRLRPWRAVEVSSVVDYVRGERLSPELRDLPSMPPLRARLEAGWNDSDYWAMARIRAAADQDRTAPQEEATPGYMLFDLEGGLRIHGGGMHFLSVRVANLLDTPYRDHMSRVRGLANPMPGRSLHLTYRWTY